MNKQPIFYLFLMSTLFLLHGCTPSKTSEAPEETKISYKDSLYIDFDEVTKYYSDKIAIGDSIAIRKDEDYQTLLIATNRFWKTVEYVNGHLWSSIKTADEINVSERVFNGFMKQLSDGNKFIQENIQKGLKPEVSISK